MPQQDWFSEGFAVAVADIRQKLVEEAWFGRPLTPRPEPSTDSLAAALGWTEADPEPAREQSAEPAAREHGIDR